MIFYHYVKYVYRFVRSNVLTYTQYKENHDFIHMAHLEILRLKKEHSERTSEHNQVVRLIHKHPRAWLDFIKHETHPSGAPKFPQKPLSHYIKGND